MTAGTKNTTLSHWGILMFICAGHFCVDFMLGIWPVFKTMAGLDLAVAGFIAGGCVFVGEGLQCLFGSLSDRGYARLLLLCGISLSASACFLSYADTYTTFLLLFLGTCLGSAAFHPTAASILTNLESNNRSSIMGFFTAAGMIGIGISQLLFSWTHEQFAGSTAILALPSLFLALLTYYFFKEKTVQASSSPENSHSFRLFLQFLKIKTLRTLYLSMLGNQIVLWSLVFLLPDFLKERGYSTWVVFGGGHLFLMAGATIGPPLFGYLADITSSRKVILTCSILTLFGFYVLLAPLQLSVEALFTVLFLLGTTLGSVPPLIWALGGQMVPQHRGVISAFLMGFVWIVSESLGLSLSGYLTTLFTQDAAAWALALMGSVQLISCYCNTELPKQVDELIIA